ncbi:MAG: asparaginase [Bacteroides sp.]|nr:asparaginase [Bacillota bacterium]MCM1455950.1 asparaginase [Bacteroides sp.]
MKKILMIATGGTIASKNNGEGLTPALTSKELLACVPEIAEFAKVTTIQPFNLDSTNLGPSHWLSIARIIEDNYALYDGFVITHGTDTMAYTAAALSYLIQNSPKPIVLTGSQKSAYLRDTDARKNLADAFAYCSDDAACGVHIVFDGNVILGTRAKKTRTHSYNAFSSVDYPDTAIMRDGKPFYYIKGEKGEAKFYHSLNDSVFVLKMIPGLKTDIFDYLENNYDALIIESFGTGGLPDYGDGAFLNRLKRFLNMGKTVVFTTQVEREGSSLETYEVGKKLLKCGRVLEARCMTLESAVAKLMWILSFATPDEIENLFYAPVGMDIF